MTAGATGPPDTEGVARGEGAGAEPTQDVA